MSLSLIQERAKTHGDFTVTARIARAFKDIVEDELPGRQRRDLEPLSDRQREALDQILMKAARIIAGDAKHEDHWRDIAGYALLGIEYDEDKDAIGSFHDAIKAIGDQAKATGEVPITGYFGSTSSPADGGS